MAKVTIQIPIDKELLARLDQVAARQEASRAAVIRTACSRYLSQLEHDERVQRYITGYMQVPDESTADESRIWLTAADVPHEEWPEAPRAES
jgi:metal-responsive CopG/Arc/MetJ family transcriptional regulator